MEKDFIIRKRVGDRCFLFDAKNMLLFDITNGFSEKEYDEIVNLSQEAAIEMPNSLSKIVLNVSNTCNYKCVYCYANHGNYGKKDAFMNLRTLKKIIDNLVSAEIQNIGIVELFGGEATLNKSLVEMVEILNSKFNINQFVITTNGSGSEDIVMKLAKYPLKYYVSVDGPRNVNDILRGDGSYNKAMEFISYLEKYNSNYSISTTYTKIHEDYGLNYKELYELAKLNNVSIGINTVISDDESIMIKQRISKTVLTREIDRTLEVLVEGDVEVNFDPYVMRILKGMFLSIKSSYFCDDLQINKSIHYDYDGSIYNCFKLWKDKRFKLDDIESRHELIDLYNRKENFNNCKKCWARYLCELCVADTFLGKEEFPFLSANCPKRKRFDLAIERILGKVASGEIEKIKENFINYL